MSEDVNQPDNDGTLRRIRVPILMYHYVSPIPPDADEYRLDLTVEPHIFRSHMQFLVDEGYSSVSLYEIHRALTYGDPLPDKPIVLTFDDGHIDHYETVFPLLQEYELSGTFFVVTGFADQNLPQYISWAQIKEMSAAGMSMQAHTKAHLDLRERDHDFLVYQIFGSVESLTAHTDAEVNMFAYPAGRYDEATLAILEDSEIHQAVTTRYGDLHTTDGTLELARLRVSGNMGIAGLAHLLKN